jgi:hypothetical protein
MTHVILQPCGNKDSRAHYTDTIETPVPLDVVQKYVDATTTASLRSSIAQDAVPIWGVTPGKLGGNVAKWGRVDAGDVALFSREGGIFSAATVVMTTQNEQLAEKLWGRDPNGQTWEYIYFLNEVRPLNLRYAEFNSAADYAENYVIQGFNVLDPDRSFGILERFDLASDTYFPNISEDDYAQAAVALPTGPLDVKASARVRTEQGFLRRHLFKNQSKARCSFCGELLPVGFLVAAHIKRRADCADEEKLDYQNVVMAMCKLGCDELFERGYLAVDNGVIVELKRGATTNRLRAIISDLVGRKCAAWSEANQQYFEAHRRRIEGLASNS